MEKWPPGANDLMFDARTLSTYLLVKKGASNLSNVLCRYELQAKWLYST
jgi:hypothetical protein